jgi:hypothetical protein
VNENIGQLVRDSLDTLTDGATVPAGLVMRARRQHRRRVAAVRISAAAATAAVTAAAVTVAVALAGSVPSRPVGRTAASLTAYVVAHAERALAPASRDVVQARAAVLVNQTSTEVLSWSDARASKTELATGSGQPLQAGGYLLRSGRVTVVTVDYRDRTWRERDITLPPSARAGAATAAPVPAIVQPLQAIFGVELTQLTRVCANSDGAPSAAFTFSWPARIQELLSCRSLTVAGRGRIDGIPVIKLVPAVSAEPGADSAVLWVSRASYLPLRLAFVPVPVAPASGSTSTAPGTPAASYQVNLRWLPATRANVAKASILPAPRGFRQLPWPAGTGRS